MKKYYRKRLMFLFLFQFYFTLLSFAQNSGLVWEEIYGGSSHDRFSTSVKTTDGGFLLGGSSYSGVSGDKSQDSKGDSDYWIVRIDDQGNKLWDKTYGGSSTDFLREIVQTNDGGFLLGGQSRSTISGDKSQHDQEEDFWIIKIDSNGNKQWDRTYGSNGVEDLTSMIITSDGGFLLGGFSYSGIAGDKSEDSMGYYDYWVIKIDSQGNKVWDKSLGGYMADVLLTVIETKEGGFLVGGYSQSPISGDKSEGSKGSNDMWIVKLNAQGIKQWDKTYGGNSVDNLMGLIQTSDEGFLLSGYSASDASGDKSEHSLGGYDYWVIKIDFQGNKLWDKTFGGSMQDNLSTAISTADGGFLLGGTSYSPASGNKLEGLNGGSDFWIVKIDGEGNSQWEKTIGKNVEEQLFDLTEISQNSYLLGGNIYSSNSSIIGYKGGVDYYVVKFEKSSECQLNALAKDITVQLGDTGNLSVAASEIDNGSFNSCGDITLSIDKNIFDCSNLGDNPVVLTVTNSHGNTATADAIVTVEDITAPVVSPSELIVELDEFGMATITPDLVANEVQENCAIKNKTLDRTSFTCEDALSLPFDINLFVEDMSGNVGQNTVTVTVVDKISPTVKLKDITVELDETGNVIVEGEDFDDGSWDICQWSSLDFTVEGGGFYTCENIGTNSVTLIVRDIFGNWTRANANVTIVDSKPPTAVAQNITVQLDATGNVAVAPSQIDNGSSDACGAVTLALDKTSFDCTNLGPNPVVLTVSDSNGNTATANATVTVEDKMVSSAVTKNITFQLDATGNVTVIPSQVDNGSYDACGDITLALDKTFFDCSNIGANPVVLTITDSNGNKATANAVVTIEDKSAPVVSAKDFTLELSADGTGSISVEDINNGSADTCDAEILLTVNKTDFTCSDIGLPIDVTLTATDRFNNSASATAKVTVVDNTAPTVSAKNFSLKLDASGSGTLLVSDILDIASDSCDEDIALTLNRTSFSCSDLGVPVEVTLTATDDYGNASSAKALVTVLDETAPVVVTKNFELVLDASGNGVISVSDINNGSYDSCDEEITLSLDRTSFSCLDIGANQVVSLTATDKYGNSDKGTANVTVVDKTAPVVVTQDYKLILGPDGTGSISHSDVDNGSDDSCDEAIQFSLSETSFDCSHIGINQIVTLTAKDKYGNSNSGTAVVTVVDETAPSVLTQNFTLVLGADGNGSIAVSDIDNGSSDSCDDAITLSLDRTSFNCSDLGNPIRVTLTTRDKYNNEASETAVVTVVDKTPPIVSAKDFILEIGENGRETLLVSDVLNGFSDGCDDEVQLSLDKSEFGCGDIGTVQVITLTAKDKYNNSNSATANITVVDKVAPALSAKDFTLVLNAQGTGTLLISDVLVSASDNCDSNLSLSLDRTEFTCEDIGTVQVVKMTAADQYGNSTTVNSNITVVDETAPVVSTSDHTLELGIDGTGKLEVQDILNSVSDSCDKEVSLSLSKEIFTCSDLGAPIQVQLTAKDKFNNTAASIATITVVDKLAPTLQVKNLEINLDVNGQSIISEVDLNNGSSDNCGIAEWQISQTSFDCSDIGSNSISVTVKDASGNTATGNATVVVKPFEVETSIDISPSSQQYSDEVTFTARIKNGTCISGSGAAQEVSFYVGSQKMGTIPLKAIGTDLVASMTTKLTESPSFPSSDQLSPGEKVVSAKFEKVNTAQYIVKNATASLAIQKENAIVEYVGQEIQATVSSTNSQATVLLKVNVQDNSVNDMLDSYPGDIRNARVKFVNRDNNSDISGWLPVQLLNSEDATTGSASFSWTVNIGSADALSYTVGIVVDNGYYYQSSSDDNVVLTVYKPNGDFITGGGYIRPSASYGEYSSTGGKKMNFGFNVKYNKKGNKLNGHMNVIFRKVINGETRIFQIKGNAIQSLGINSKDRTVKTAEFITKSNLTDITNPLSPVSLGGNLILKVNMTDWGEPGTNDLIGVSLTDNNTLLFSSHWNGLSTEEINLTGGNLVIHSNSVSAGPQETDVVKTVKLLADTPVLDAVVSPNPSDSYFTLKVDSQNQKDRVQVTVHSYSGAILYNKFGKPSEQYIFGNDFAAGTYIVKVYQATQMVEKIIIKN